MEENSPHTNAKEVNGNESDELRAKFLKDALSYLEARINLVDNKASILIAIQGGLFALVTWLIKEVFWTTMPSIVNWISFSVDCISFIVLTVLFFIMILTILLLVQTIRPGKWFFGLEVLPKDKLQTEGYVMWPEGGFPHSQEEYQDRITNRLIIMWKYSPQYDIVGV